MSLSVIWLQNRGHEAREDRQIISSLFTEGVIDKAGGHFAVTQRAAGANMSVDVAVGEAVIDGDDQPDQGAYLAESTSVENVPIGAAPGSNSRIDLIVLQVNDPDAGGDPGNNVTLEVVAGTVAASPVAPAVPDSAIVLAQVLVTSATASIVNAAITDRRTQVTSPIVATRTQVGGFVVGGAGGNLAPSVTDQQLYRSTSTDTTAMGAGQGPVPAMRAGWLTGIGVAMLNARTGGTATFEVWKNGVATGLTAVIDGTNPQYKVTTQVIGLDALVAGDRLDIRATTDAAWATTAGEQGEAFLEITYEP